jgi:ribosomal-protein-alanine N-acetyltransferase
MEFQDQKDILTRRLALIAITPDSVRSEQANDRQLEMITSACVPATWPPEHWEPHVFDLLLERFAADPGDVGWHRYIALRHEDGSGRRTLIGTLGAFRRAEKPDECEIGYSVLAEHHRQGYATEGAQALIDWAFSHAFIQTITAQTFPTLPASIRVMEKCGMRFVGPGYEEGTVLYQRCR